MRWEKGNPPPILGMSKIKEAFHFNLRKVQFCLVGLCTLVLPIRLSHSHTTPIGCVIATIPAAADSTTPSNAAVSVPLFSTASYVGTVASVDSSSSFTSSGASWTTGQFTGSPYLVRIKSGSNTGRFFLITANTGNQLTVVTQGDNLTQILAANDTCEIFPANTLGRLFGTTSPVLKPGN